MIYTDNGETREADASDSRTGQAPFKTTFPELSREETLSKYVAQIASEPDLAYISSSLDRLSHLSFSQLEQEIERTNLPVKSFEDLKSLKQLVERRRGELAEEYVQKHSLLSLVKPLEEKLTETYRFLKENEPYFLNGEPVVALGKERYSPGFEKSNPTFRISGKQVELYYFYQHERHYDVNSVRLNLKKSLFSAEEHLSVGVRGGIFYKSLNYDHDWGLSSPQRKFACFFELNGFQRFLELFTQYLETGQQKIFRCRGFSEWSYPDQSTLGFLKFLLRSPPLYRKAVEKFKAEKLRLGREYQEKTHSKVTAVLDELKREIE